MVALILILAVGVSSQLAIRARRAEVLATRRLAEVPPPPIPYVDPRPVTTRRSRKRQTG